jgi:hypothetical protein
MAFKKGLVPGPVKAALQRDAAPAPCPKAETILLASSAAELGNPAFADPAVKALAKIGIKASVYAEMTGSLSFVLGDVDSAKRQAEAVIRMIAAGGVKRIITDGVQGLFSLRVIYPLLGVQLPKGIQINSLAEVLAEKAKGNVSADAAAGKTKVYVHDSRAACLLADEMSSDEALKPELDGNESLLGKGEIYEATRRIVDEAGLTRVFGVWSRALSKSCGTDDGLWITYPEIAKKLALSKLDYVAGLGAEVIITDDLLNAEYLKKTREEKQITMPIIWLPELF